MRCLNEKYSTTRLVSTIKPEIENYPETKFQTHLFLPVGEGRKGEGGMRTNGYFKHSYEIFNGKWYITDNFGLSRDNVQHIPVDESRVPEDLIEYVQKNLVKDGESGERVISEYRPLSFNQINLPLITVITVVFNGEKYLEETIQSVLKQTYDNVEYIIIDGGSIDGTLDIINKYEEQIDYWVSENDEGIYDAMNKGIQLSHGEIISILNSDDWYQKEALKIVSQKFCGNYKIGLVHGAMAKWDKNGIKTVTYGSRAGIYEILMPPFNHPTCFFRKNVYKTIGIFDCTFATAADYDLMLRFLNSKQESLYLDMHLVNFRQVGVTSRSTLFPVLQIWYLLKKNGYSLQARLYAIAWRSFRSILIVFIKLFRLEGIKKNIRKHLSYHKL